MRISVQYRTEETYQKEGSTLIRILHKVPIYHWDEKRSVTDTIKTRLYDIFSKYANERNVHS